MTRNKIAWLALLSLILSIEILINTEASGKRRTVLISERILLNTDRKVYIAGENLLYSLFLIDSKANTLATYPSIGYVILKSTKGELVGKSQVKVISGKATGAIYLSDTLQSGYYQIMAYTNFMRNGSPDIFFKSQVLIANRFDNDFFNLLVQGDANNSEMDLTPFETKDKTQVNITSLQASYDKRGKCSLKVNIQNEKIKFTDVSVAVVEENLIEEQFSKKTGTSASVDRASVITTLGEDSPVHLAEDKYAEISGRLTNADDDPVGYHVLYLTSPDTVTNFEYAVTNAGGYFRFPLPDYYCGKDLFIKAKQNEGESLHPKITPDSKFDYKEPFLPETWPVDSLIISYLKNSQDIVRTQKSYSQIQSHYQSNHLSSTTPFLYKVPDFTVFPAEYSDLKDFVEISREIIPTLKIRKHEQRYSAEILDISHSRYLPPTPMIFLDGVLIDEIEQVIPYGTKDIRKVNVISSEWIVDHQNLAGVLSIFSTNNLWKAVSLNSDNLRIKAEDYFELPKPNSPNYSIVDSLSREPDFRQLLYWDPHLHLNSGNSTLIEFYTSDYAAKYLVKISGVTDKGEKIEAYSEFEVKD